MQLVNHTPVSHAKPVCLTALKLGEIVARRVGIHRNLLDLRNNPLLPVRRKLGDGLIEGSRRDDRVHGSIVRLG